MSSEILLQMDTVPTKEKMCYCKTAVNFYHYPKHTENVLEDVT